MDFKLEISGTTVDMTWEKAETILNNIWLSLMIRKGSFFQDPERGSRLYLLKGAKATDANAALAKTYCEEAAQWILDAGRAKSIEVETWLENNDSGKRILIHVQAVQADGRNVTFETFLEVI